MRAKAFAAKDDFKNAVIHFQLALTRVPEQNRELRSEIYYDLGQVLWRAGRQNEAFNHFQKAAEVDPASIEANLRVAQLLVSGGALSEAIPYIEQAQALDPGNPQVLATMGAIEAASGHEIKARTYLISSLNSDPSNSAVAIALAELYSRRNRIAEARQVLKNCADHDPASAAPWLAMARLEEQEGNMQAAEQDYRSAVKAEDSVEANLRLSQFLQRTSQIKEAEEVLKRVDDMQPSNSTSLPDFQLITGRPLKAIQSYLRALALNQLLKQDKKENASQPELASRVVESQLQSAVLANDAETRRHFIKEAKSLLAGFGKRLDPGTKAVLNAEVALAENQNEVAQKQAQAAVDVAPDSAAAHYVKGVVLARQGRSAEAKVEWNAGLLSDETHVPTRLALGEALLSEGSLPGAEELVAGSVRLEPANIQALQLYSRVLLQEGRLAAASAIANRAIAIDADALGARMTLGDVALRRGDLREALTEYQKAVVSDPQSATALHGLVQVYRYGHVSPEMVQHIESIAKLPPPSAPLMEIAGRLYAEMGEYKEAARVLRDSIRLDGKRSSAVLALGQVYAETGQTHAAEQVLASSKISGGEKQQIASLIDGLQAEQANDKSKAIEKYEQALRLGERTGIAANNLAWLYASMGSHLDRALHLAKQASEISPEDPAVVDTLGMVHLKRRDYTNAIIELKHAAELVQAQGDDQRSKRLSSAIYLHLAEAYEAAGERDSAAAARSQARLSLPHPVE